MAPADVLTSRPTLLVDSSICDPKEMEAASKVGMMDKCSTLVGEVARMATRIIVEKRESLKEKAAQA